jgi:hypothetical protein
MGRVDTLERERKRGKVELANGADKISIKFMINRLRIRNPAGWPSKGMEMALSSLSLRSTQKRNSLYEKNPLT